MGHFKSIRRWICKWVIPGFIFLFLVTNLSFAQEGRTEIEISGEDWTLWLDRAADWNNDNIYLPPVDVSALPVNSPTVGWETLHSGQVDKKEVSVPGTVEEYYWGEIGGAETSSGPRSGGDYVGVSWWSSTFELDSKLEGKRITFHFEQVNLRAEVFVNGRLVGYDVIGNTPFEFDATDAVRFGEENRIDVRITDPVGNFTWNDNILMRWGENKIPAVHGFGGITGKIFLRATDDIHIDDIYVQNQPDPKRVKVRTTIRNHTGLPHDGELSVVLHEYGNPEAVVWNETVSAAVDGEQQVFEVEAHAPDARLWKLSGWQGKGHEETALYEATVTYATSDAGITDSESQRFGFRWFDVGEKDGDKRFYLNGERVFIMAAMTRGFWPVNGIFATPEMAQRDMEAMFELGFNMMLMHRAIGQPPVFEYADKNGLLTYQEPAGYKITANPEDNIEGPDQQARALRREKLRRMVIRDRSFPSSVIYNLKNEALEVPNYDDIINMQMVHELDPTRILTYNSGQNRDTPYDERWEKDPYRLHMLPYDDEFHWNGWWDNHYWVPFSGYVDENYNSPDYFLRDGPGSPRMPLPRDSTIYHDPTDLIFHGEEGAFGTMVRLQQIKEELEQKGSAAGFREQEHLDWFNHYDNWLDESGFRQSYATVDDLTKSLGRNLHYFQGRNVENVRMNNVGDAYVMNGWASGGTRTDVVDMYRNPTADPAILQQYLQPLYVAVKLRNKVVPNGFRPVADLWIVNEENLNGNYTLVVDYQDPSGETVFRDEFDVSVSGGEVFGELLVEGVALPEVEDTGHYTLSARIVNGEREVQATGFDDLFAVDLDEGPGIRSSIAVLEQDSQVSNFLSETRDIESITYRPGMDPVEAIVVGNLDPQNLDQEILSDIIRRAANGTYVVVLENADLFADQIDRRLRVRPELLKQEGVEDFGSGGRYFVNRDPVLAGLPQGEGMSWEYQAFYKPNFEDPRIPEHDIQQWNHYSDAAPVISEVRKIRGLRLHLGNHQPIVALGSQSSKDILTGLGRVPVGEGTVMLSTLNILHNLHTPDRSAVVAQKLLLNLLTYR